MADQPDAICVRCGKSVTPFVLPKDDVKAAIMHLLHVSREPEPDCVIVSRRLSAPCTVPMPDACVCIECAGHLEIWLYGKAMPWWEEEK